VVKLEFPLRVAGHGDAVKDFVTEFGRIRTIAALCLSSREFGGEYGSQELCSDRQDDSSAVHVRYRRDGFAENGDYNTCGGWKKSTFCVFGAHDPDYGAEWIIQYGCANLSAGNRGPENFVLVELLSEFHFDNGRSKSVVLIDSVFYVE
jgi:hypothetical protein